MDEKNIIILLKKGNHEAFSSVYNTYWSKVYNFSRLYMICSDDAKEAVQSVFVKLWEVREFLDESKSLEGLLFIMTRNFIFSQSKKRLNEEFYKTSVLQAYNEEYIQNHCDIEEQIATKQLSQYIDQLIDSLPERQKMAFNLSRKQHLSYNKIAQIMGISEKGVEKLITKALKYLRQNYTLLLIFLLYAVISLLTHHNIAF